MEKQASIPPAKIDSLPVAEKNSVGAKPPVPLWTSWQIFWTGFFLGWPGAFTLAVIDWFRMGRKRKGLVFLGFGLLWLVLFTILLFLSQHSQRTGWLIINPLVLLILKSALDKDLPGLDLSRYGNASFWKGGLIALGVLAAYLGIIFELVFIIGFFSVLFRPGPVLP